MFFLNPSFLWALIGLGVPLAIHIWSKKQEKHIKVGSIKYLQESDAQKSRSLKINEIALLLLRMLLIALLVFILSKPRLPGEKDSSSLTYIVEASLLDSPNLKKLVDSLNQKKEVRLLENNFPIYTEDYESSDLKSDLDYWQLGRAMQNLNTDSIIVFTNAFLKHIKGKRPALQNHINWVPIGQVQPTTTLVGIIKRGVENELISVSSTSNSLKFIKRKKEVNSTMTDSLPSIEADTIRINLVAEGKLNQEGRYLKMVFSAIANYLNHPIEINSVNKKEILKSNSPELLIWLSQDPVPETTAKVLRFKEDALASSLIMKGENDQDYILTSALNSENIVNERLGIELIDILKPYSSLEQAAMPLDERVMGMDQLQTRLKKRSSLELNQNGQDFSEYLWIGFFILLCSERLLSKHRKQ
ncbi:BatA domain-containing protein [Psychroflexus tropicus]|uniref:BatA domain-containing protein n=1 Tax=Psychroflexus tropicus TaxID=197345 RepID=UPI00036D4CD8|nr:BatA domain-containing protein [Psychroflexus tropicus]